MKTKVLIFITIITLAFPCVAYAADTGFSIQGIVDAIMNLPNNLIQPIKDAINQTFKDWSVEMYSYVIDDCVNSCLNTLPTFLKDTPALWSETSPTVINVITNALKPICITLATIGFIINLGKAMAGSVAQGRTVTRCFIRLIFTVILIGYSGQLLQWIIDFNDAFIQFLDSKISLDIVTAFRNVIVDRSVIESASATLSSIIMVVLTGWIIWIAALFVQFALIFRLIQIMFYMLISPLVFTCNITEETTDIIKSYMRKFVSVVLKSFFYNLIFLVYITCITLPNAIPVGILTGAICTIVLIISMFKIPKEFEELLGIGKAASFNVGSLITAIATSIALL
ncbi:MAG: hypothetical protein ACM3UU_11330 [Ignavibacteriales bacterium]